MTSETRTWREAASTAAFALGLTAVMAAALFVSVALNPKDESYGHAPWFYAGGSAVFAALLLAWHRRLDRSLRPGGAR
jgi:hypothetical protein